ncbi:MAG TPA: amidohydrolase family protein [Novosphingobium sp.]|nr:amidohydrolase family protein [Novosphingobium sp.]
MTKRTMALGTGLAGSLAALLAGCATIAPSGPLTQRLLIDHVNVVDVRDGSVGRDRAILIENGKIVRVMSGGSMRAGGAARAIDGKGAFVVPGFNDMHAHNLNTASPETNLPAMLASGVTGFRQMAPVDPAMNVANLPANSPALLARPGRLLAGPAFAAPAAVKAEVDRQKAAGFDFIKVVDLPVAPFLAAADEARAQGLPFAGHLPPTVDPRMAMRSHMASIEHMGPTISLLLACSRDEAAVRAVLAAVPPGVGMDFSIDPARLQRLLANPVMLTPPQGFGLIRRVLATYDETKCRAFAAELAASDTWIVPTLTRLEAMNLGNSAELRDNPDLQYVPAASRQLWREVGIDFDAKLSADQRQVLADLFAAQLKLTKLFDDAGVKMLAGTDFGGQWIVPGRSLHREFDLLSRSGVSPLHVLQMATLGPARFLGREASMGTVEAGRNADLVLLDGDPTLSAANLHKVAGVVRAGRYLSKQELRALSNEIAAKLRR